MKDFEQQIAIYCYVWHIIQFQFEFYMENGNRKFLSA